jgi:hypothetical protein
VISIVVVSKDEPRLDETLDGVRREAEALDAPTEVLVVDASRGRLNEVRRRHPEVAWVDFAPPPGVSVSIPHQRNLGVRRSRGEIVVFTDSGCVPRPGWLAALVSPIAERRESVTAGIAPSPGDTHGPYDAHFAGSSEREYLREAPTINLAFRRSAFEAVGGFDERFEYGSDVDFTWRLREAGHRIRSVPGAVVEHDWGSAARQVRRAYQYGIARARLYRKHRRARRDLWRADPIVVAYPAFLLGLPLALVFRFYPLLLLVPAWRNRDDRPVRVVAHHLVFGAGVLREVSRR